MKILFGSLVLSGCMFVSCGTLPQIAVSNPPLSEQRLERCSFSLSAPIVLPEYTGLTDDEQFVMFAREASKVFATPSPDFEMISRYTFEALKAASRGLVERHHVVAARKIVTDLVRILRHENRTAHDKCRQELEKIILLYQKIVPS